MDPSLTFGRFEFRSASRQLLVDSQPAFLGPRALDLLSVLIDRRGQIVGREELLALVWPNVVVEENNLEVQVSALRKVLGSGAIATIPRRGYRFTLEETGAGTVAFVRNGNLPSPITSFVGRERQLAEVTTLLSRSRIVTLTGVGGIGKTRLSLQVAAAVRNQYRDGVWLVELASIRDGSLVPKTVAQALGVREEGGKTLTRTLCNHFENRHVLVVLDNCEHLLEACAQLTSAILGATAGTVIIATSREALRIGGEQVYPLAPMELPDGTASTAAAYQNETVQLFVERARRQRPAFELTAERTAAVIRLCAHLDGIPLAVELAAARMSSLSVEELCARIDDRFRLLTQGMRSSLPRQQTLRATLDWSHDLLDEKERTLFRRLAVFSGGWFIEAAEAVCAAAPLEKVDILGIVIALADKSLVLAEDDTAGTRYRMLETVREYSKHRLMEAAESEQAGARHLAYFTALAEDASAGVKSARQRACLDRLSVEHDNLRSALSHARATNPSAGLPLASALAGFWRVRGHLDEGRAWLSEFIAAEPEAAAGVRAGALAELGALIERQSDYNACEPLLEESLSLYRRSDDRGGVSKVLATMGNLARGRGRYPEAVALFAESLAVARGLGQSWEVASLLESLASVAFLQADRDKASALYDESLAIRRQLGDQRGIAQVVNGLGAVAFAQGKYAKSHALFSESLALRHELRDQHGIAQALHNLAQSMRYQGEHPRALALFRDALARQAQLGEKESLAFGLESIAYLTAHLGDSLCGARLWGAAQHLREVVGSPLPPSDVAAYADEVAEARSILADDASFEVAWRDGRAMTLDDAIRLALVEPPP
jgi:non-specific serine/threonine protein kinase